MKNRIFLIFIFFIIGISSFSQQHADELSILFYNVENLFDTKDDPITNDDEFTPAGDRHWTSKRLDDKLQKLSKVILSAAAWNSPTIIALSEIENRKVLEKLINYTPIKSKSYKIIHKESPDHRGIDVGIIYDTEKFYPLSYQHYPLKNKNGSIKSTREILLVSGILDEIDTVHIFVNHWPSRYGGLLETKPERKKAAALLREKVNELIDEFNSPKIIIMGDFNDQPKDESILKVLNSRKVDFPLIPNELYNLSYDWANEKLGTLKYRSQWSVFDQIIVSGTLIVGNKGYIVKVENASIVDYPYLLEKDERYGGEKPKRTYYGYKYQGGFSDHLPVILRLERVD